MKKTWGTVIAIILWFTFGSPPSRDNVRAADFLPWVDVRAYGTVGDGVTDDSAAFQAAFDAGKSGKPIYIPTGNYYLATSINGTTGLDDGSGTDSSKPRYLIRVYAQ